mgnify:CR=1 FL=1
MIIDATGKSDEELREELKKRGLNEYDINKIIEFVHELGTDENGITDA